MGFEVISKFAHALEDLFSEIKQSNIQIEEENFYYPFSQQLINFKELVESLSDDKLNVRYRGIQRKLEVIVEGSRKAEKHQEQTNQAEETVPKKTVPKTKKSSIGSATEKEKAVREVAGRRLKRNKLISLKKLMAVEEEKEMITAEEKDAKKNQFLGYGASSR